MVYAIGIDLGTSNSCVGVFQHGDVEIVSNSDGDRTTPSIVAFTDRGLLVGEAARNQMSINTRNTVYDVKRLIGKRFKDIKASEINQWPFNVIDQNKQPAIEVSTNGQLNVHTPEDVSAIVLMEMKKIAEEQLNNEVTSAVITVPAYFTDSQKKATIKAAEKANLKVLQLINEPTAAAIAYGLKEKLESNQNILVFDLGGGTFDVSILNITSDFYEVKAVGGDTNLGGKDFSNKIRNYFVEEIEQKHGVDISTDKVASSLLLQECEKAKIALSTSTIASVQVDGLYNGINFKSEITRARFEDLNAEFFEETIRIVDKTLSDSKLDKADIQEVVLVGGSTYIPKVQSLLKDYFDGKELNKSVKPDEAVAFGAAVLASILNPDGDNDFDIVLVDVTPFSLGIAVEINDEMMIMIKKNTSVPVRVIKTTTTLFDDQTEINYRIYEGEADYVKENNLLGSFILSGIPPHPRGVVKIETTMDIDVNGILALHAVSKLHGVENKILIREYKEKLKQDG